MESSSHTDFVKNIATAICTLPEDIEIQSTVDERGVLIQLYVNQEDLGRIIGKKGETATAIRTLLRGLGVRNNAHYGFKVAARNGTI